MGNCLFVNYDSKSPVRKDISVRFRAPHQLFQGIMTAQIDSTHDIIYPFSFSLSPLPAFQDTLKQDAEKGVFPLLQVPNGLRS